jgi:Phage integrase family
MFKTLFKYPRVLARHREGPVADARERFLIHCAEQGLARESLLRTAREVLIIAKHIDLTTGKTISIHDVEAAADRWGVHQQRRHRLRGFALDGSRQLFIQKALPWLRFLDRLEELDNETIPFACLLEDFAVYMRDQRGLSAVTIRNRCWHVEKFLEWLSELNRSFAEYHLVSSRLSELSIQIPRRGPHSLRHACAGHLVAEGLSLKEIGDHLGHRSAYATRIYAKVDLAGLREVANFELGGLL